MTPPQVLDFMANLTFDAEGCAALLRTDEAFDVLLDALGSRHAPNRAAAALALRNVAFAPDGKAALLSKPRALPSLLAGIDARQLGLAALCSGALWALICRRAPEHTALTDHARARTTDQH